MQNFTKSTGLLILMILFIAQSASAMVPFPPWDPKFTRNSKPVNFTFGRTKLSVPSHYLIDRVVADNEIIAGPALFLAISQDTLKPLGRVMADLEAKHGKVRIDYIYNNSATHRGAVYNADGDLVEHINIHTITFRSLAYEKSKWKPPHEGHEGLYEDYIIGNLRRKASFLVPINRDLIIDTADRRAVYNKAYIARIRSLVESFIIQDE